MKRVLTILGTRPEAIKLAPVILELDKHSDRFDNLVSVTAQHREMLDQVLEWFGIRTHYDLDLMQPNQSLAEFGSRALIAVSELIKKVQPDVVLVQGDTSTVMIAALSAFYQHIPVGHVEAGLRTRDRYNPFPEEINRRLAGALTTFHFAPTARAADALKSEQVPEEDIFITGNTVVDALLMTRQRPVNLNLGFNLDERRLILVTAHRRESFGTPFESLCLALRDIAERNNDVEIAYPVHLNPNVQGPARRILSEHLRIHLLDPLRYEQFVHLMVKAHIILTDSGGIQEEAPVLGKPVLVMRETTERPEAIDAGSARLVGTSRQRIVAEAERLLNDEEVYRSMAQAASPFGDGRAAERIVNILLTKL
ncbi:MAG: UDP-N-acetylglucosamine 2-epimerase (non-hydrolyzing) [Deltaproteobacteria bacterium]|nr:UDP-N-acetylglucosamine 2-epimerase (non-hydrolyzing) [Deltaproteobacteria bacterium]